MPSTSNQSEVQDKSHSSVIDGTYPWQALSPWAMLSFIFKTFRLFVTNAYALLPFVYTGWSKGFSSPLLIGGMLAFSISIMLFSLGSWLKFRFRIQQDQLDIRRGVIFRKTDEIPFNKIQNVRLQQAFYLRPLKLYSLIVETAGSKKDEAELSAINYRQALKLKRQLLRETQPLSAEDKNNKSTSTQTQVTDNKPKLMVSRSIKQLVQFGWYQNNAIWLAVILGPILGQLEWETFFDHELIDSSIQWYQTQTEDNQLIQAGILAIALTLCYLVFAMISIISSLLKYHPYTLTLSGLTLHRAGGLIAKQNDALKLGRIQVVRFSQPLLARFLKLWTLSFKQVQGHEVESRGQHMLIPSMKRQEIGTLLPKLQGLASGSTELPHKFTGINIIWFWRRASFVPPIALILGIVFHDTVMTLLLLITSLIAIISIYLRYRQWGYVIDDKDIWIHSGFLGHTWHCIPMIKVQHVALIQTHGQKKRSLANIEIGLASGLLTIPSIDESIASQLSERILNTISLDHHNWI